MFLIFAFSSSHGLSKHNDAAIRIVIWKFYFKTLPPFFFGRKWVNLQLRIFMLLITFKVYLSQVT